MTVCERIFREFKYELPSTGVGKFRITGEVVRNPRSALSTLLDEDRAQEARSAHEIVESFTRQFAAVHSLMLHITDEGVEMLLELARSERRPLLEICEVRFKDFQFGLKLIAQNTGRKEFIIDRATVAQPERVLSEWVVQSYRQTGQ